MAFKNRLKEARLRKKMTQEQLGELVGVAKSTITSYEKGNSEPDMMKMYKLMMALDVDANYLLQDEVFTSSTKEKLSPDAIDVAQAYDKADFKSKNSARYALDLPLLEPALDKKNDLCVNPPQVNTLMVAARGGGVFEVPIDHPFTDEDEKELDEIAARSMEENKDL